MKRVWTYLGITFALTYAIEFGLMAAQDYLLLTGGAVLLQLGLSAAMFMPLIGVVLTTLIFHDKFKALPLRPRIKGNVKWYLAALFGPTALTVLGAAVYFLVFPENFDPSMTAMIEATEAQLGAAGQTMDRQTIVLMSLVQALFAITLAPFINMVFAFGEEIGWRGYMMPRLCERFGAKKAILLGGVIWGVWHAPAIALGHNYGTDYPGFPWLGIFAMCVFCVALGCLLTWISFRVGSVWPAALAHGALNAVASLGIIFVRTANQPFAGPVPTGFLGGSAMLLLAVIAFISIGKLDCAFPAESAGGDGEVKA